jgi:hypothetical protein
MCGGVRCWSARGETAASIADAQAQRKRDLHYSRVRICVPPGVRNYPDGLDAACVRAHTSLFQQPGLLIDQPRGAGGVGDLPPPLVEAIESSTPAEQSRRRRGVTGTDNGHWAASAGQTDEPARSSGPARRSGPCARGKLLRGRGAALGALLPCPAGAPTRLAQLAVLGRGLRRCGGARLRVRLAVGAVAVAAHWRLLCLPSQTLTISSARFRHVSTV